MGVRERLRGVLGLSLAIAGGGVLAVVLLAIYLPSWLPSDPAPAPGPGPASSPGVTGPDGRRAMLASSPRSAPPTGPRRLPVAGAEGYTVVVNPSGESYMEGPDGKRTVLVEPNPPPAVSPQEVEARLAERLAQLARDKAARKNEPGRLVVLDEGVVEVPLTSVVTLQSKDK